MTRNAGLTPQEREAFLAEVTGNLTKYSVMPLRLIGAMIILGAISTFLTEGLNAIANILLNLVAGSALISFGEWHSESKTHNWYRLNAIYFILLATLATGSRINPLGPALAMQGEVMLLLVSGLLLRQASDVLRLTLPAGLIAYAIANPWHGPADQAGYATLLFVCANLGAYLIGWFLEATRIDEFKLRQRLSDNEFIDPVTRVPTLAGFLKAYRLESARAARFSIPFSAFVIEIEGVDSLLPSHTLAEILQHLTAIFLRGRQAGDVVGYAGDNRFLLLLVGATPEDGLFITERLKADVASSPLMLSNGHQIAPTAIFSIFDPEKPGSKVLN